MNNEMFAAAGEAIARVSEVTVHALALCAWREARGEGEDGMRGVMFVIVHRARLWYDAHLDPIHYAIYQRGQFTSMSDPRDPQYRLHPADGDQQWAWCLNEAKAIVLGAEQNDPTNGALYYANVREIPADGWFMRHVVESKAHPLLAVINHHSYFA